MQNGTSTDDAANAAPKLRWLDVRVTSLRKAKLEPRNTIPSAASESGTNSVSVIDANASGNPVHSTTRQKISQTWFASHTGPIEWLITGRGAPPRSAPPAVRSQNPAPKSAPPNSAYAVIPTIRITATTSLTGPSSWRSASVGDAAAARRLRTRAARAVDLGLRSPSPEPAAHQPQHQDQRDADPRVDHQDREERDPHPGVAGRGLLDLHVVAHDPRLATDLGDDPARLERDHRQHAGGGRDARGRACSSAVAA